MPMMELSASFGTAGVMAATWAHAALRPGSQVFGHTLIAGDNPAEVALTFDDGPNSRSTEPLLELLALHNVRATFFMIGRFVHQHPGLARKVHAAGHIVGNHTMTHPWLAWQPARRIREELHSCQDELQNAIGAPVRYFRPPHGARRPVVLRAARELGLTTVQWNAMGFDWEPIDAARIVANIQRGRTRAAARIHGSNILLHDGCDLADGADRSETVKATALLLESFRLAGNRIVTVDAWR